MSRLYGVRYANSRELIAVSDDMWIIKNYVEPLIQSGLLLEVGLVPRNYLSDYEIEELTLVQIGLQFIPQKYADACELFLVENTHEIMSTFNVLEGLYREGGLSSSEKKSVSRTLEILRRKTREFQKAPMNEKILSQLKADFDTKKGKLYIDDR